MSIMAGPRPSSSVLLKNGESHERSAVQVAMLGLELLISTDPAAATDLLSQLKANPTTRQVTGTAANSCVSLGLGDWCVTRTGEVELSTVVRDVAVSGLKAEHDSLRLESPVAGR